MQMIEKWLLEIENGELIVKSRPVSKFAPINRILEEVGHYNFEFLNVNGIDYLCVYDPSEQYTKKTKVLVAKTLNDAVVDLDESDKSNMIKIAKHYFDYEEVLIN